MRVLFAASEIYPFVKTGGLGDVAAALPLALRQEGHDIRLLLPGYSAILDKITNPKTLGPLKFSFSGKDDQLLKGTLPGGLEAYVLDCPHFYNRSGPYVDETGQDWPDNHLRFGALAKAAATLFDYDAPWRPDIIHGNDWQCGLIPAYLNAQEGYRPASITTIHNLAYQGLFPAGTMSELGLPQDSFSMNGLEYHGQVGFLKAGIYYSDAVTTVSPTYALEIQETEHGCGLDGLLKGRHQNLIGILNGVDTTVWDPARDSHIESPYDASTLKSKKTNRKSLLAEAGLSIEANRPVFGVISRLVEQKGLDLLLEAISDILRAGAALVLLGTGDKKLEQEFQALAETWPTQVAVTLGYDEAFAHRIIAGADCIIVPSRFEPCGLVQMYALRYGTVPVVRRTGGLADSVRDTNRTKNSRTTGFLFDEATPEALGAALMRAHEKFSKPEQWKRLQKNGMAEDFSWKRSAREYSELYQSFISQRK